MRGSFPIQSAPAAALALALVGCPSTEPKRPVVPEPSIPVEAEPAPSTPWSACLERFTPTGAPSVDIERLGRLCGAPNGQHPFAPPRVGKQTESAPVARYSLHAGGDGKCYRIYAVGDRNVEDIDVTVVAPSGERLAFDGTSGGVAALPQHEPLCLAAKGIYTVEVSVARGGGEYAFQVWSN